MFTWCSTTNGLSEIIIAYLSSFASILCPFVQVFAGGFRRRGSGSSSSSMAIDIRHEWHASVILGGEMGMDLLQSIVWSVRCNEVRFS